MQTPFSPARDTVALCQHCFRALLQALARPCQPQKLPEDLSGAHLPLPWELASIALTLCDQTSAVHLGEGLNNDDVAGWLRFQTGMNFVQNASEADFVLVRSLESAPALASLRQGTPAYPDRSATLVVCDATFSGCPDILAKGPGIRDTVPLPFVPTKTFLEEWQDNNDRFPQGVAVCRDISETNAFEVDPAIWGEQVLCFSPQYMVGGQQIQNSENLFAGLSQK